jgi:hypothetical protein
MSVRVEAPKRQTSLAQELFAPVHLHPEGSVETSQDVHPWESTIRGMQVCINQLPMTQRVPFTREQIGWAVNIRMLQLLEHTTYQAFFSEAMRRAAPSPETPKILFDTWDGIDDIEIPEHISVEEVNGTAETLYPLVEVLRQLAEGNPRPFQEEVIEPLIAMYEERFEFSEGLRLFRDMQAFFDRSPKVTSVLHEASLPITRVLDRMRQTMNEDDLHLIVEAFQENLRNIPGISHESATYIIGLIDRHTIYHYITDRELELLFSAIGETATALEMLHGHQQPDKLINSTLDPYTKHLKRLRREAPYTLGVKYVQDSPDGPVYIAEKDMSEKKHEALIAEYEAVMEGKIAACESLRERLRSDARPTPRMLDQSEPRNLRAYEDIQQWFKLLEQKLARDEEVDLATLVKEAQQDIESARVADIRQARENGDRERAALYAAAAMLKSRRVDNTVG